MDPANAGRYQAAAVQCFACAARDAERRQAGDARHSKQYGDAAFDGLYIAVTDPGGDDGGT